MKESTFEMLCCPLCKGALVLRIETTSSEHVTEGSTVCNHCNKEYSIHDGIPRMYIPDNEIIALSDNEEFVEFIITPQNLDRWIKTSKTRSQSTLLTNQLLRRYMLLLGAILLFFGVVLVILSSLNSGLAIPSLIIYFLIGISIALFIVDYFRYRVMAETQHSTNLRTLKELSDRQELGEYYLHIATQDREKDFESDFAVQKSFTAHKGKKVASILDSQNLRVKGALNVGCGGTLVKSVAEPYFDRGYDMVGVDVSEEYLREFNQIFRADVVQANGIALPFGSNNFDLVSFTDILEHLHHPFLGLSEAQRVLRAGGVIILTTPNHCSYPLSSINPLLFVERAVSLYCDRVLPPRNVLTHWMGLNFYHTEFSKAEITRLMEAAGFEILNLETEFPTRERLNKILKRFPVLRLMGTEFVITGKKKEVGAEVFQ